MSQNDTAWKKLIGTGRLPNKAELKSLEAQIIEEIQSSEEFLKDFHNHILIQYRKHTIAGLRPDNNYEEIIPMGRAKECFSNQFWVNLSEKLAKSYVGEEEKPTTIAPDRKTKSAVMDKFVNHKDNKSNRSMADYCELMVIKNLCQLKSLPFAYELDLLEITSKMLSLPDGSDRKTRQDENIPKLVSGSLQAMEMETLSQDYNKVEWVGREVNGKTSGTEDIVIYMVSGKTVRISLKSTKEGSGTLKNLGAEPLKKLGIDLSERSNAMIKGVNLAVREKFPELLLSDDTSQDDAKRKIKSHPEAKQLASDLSVPYLKEMNSSVGTGLASLPSETLFSFVNDTLLDIKESSLWVVGAVFGEASPTVSQQNKKLEKTDALAISDIGDKSFKITKNGLSFIRVNTCCPNGKGLSAVCLRVFFDDAQNHSSSED